MEWCNVGRCFASKTIVEMWHRNWTQVIKGQRKRQQCHCPSLGMGPGSQHDPVRPWFWLFRLLSIEYAMGAWYPTWYNEWVLVFHSYKKGKTKPRKLFRLPFVLVKPEVLLTSLTPFTAYRSNISSIGEATAEQQRHINPWPQSVYYF